MLLSPMSFKPEQIRRDLIVNERSSEFWDLVHSCLEKLDLKLIEAKSQGVLIAEQDPLKFVASFIAAMDRKVPIILGNYRWGDSEWASFNREFSPAVILGYGNSQRKTDLSLRKRIKKIF